MTPKLSIIIPAFNETARVGQSISTVLSYLNDRREQSELIVVDDGSTDETASVADDNLRDTNHVSTRLIRYEDNRGKGYAVRLGLLQARANIALFSDADLSTPISEVAKLIDPIRAGDADLTFGSRALDRRLIGAHQPWRREQGGRVFNLIVRVATGLPFWDTQCGFKAFRLDVCRPILEAARIVGFAFDVELLFLAHRAGLRLREIPVRWNHYEGSKIQLVRDSLAMLREVIALRAR
jgi:glycosyltransferase involved in cell wall biosynthesis